MFMIYLQRIFLNKTDSYFILDKLPIAYIKCRQCQNEHLRILHRRHVDTNSRELEITLDVNMVQDNEKFCLP
jgi:hypothetical protein